jgi:L-alanine-DL-glutamate epimerase-like enolase superfamily enzyme
MKITAIRTTPFRIKLAKPLGFAHGAMTDTSHVLVEIDTDEGLTGIAEAPSRPFFYGESQRSIVSAIQEWFAPVLIGTDPFDTGSLWRRLDKVEHNLTAKGAIDIALHDIIGKALGVSCRRLLGGATDEVRVTYVCGYSSPQEMAAEAVRMNETHGIDSFKIKIGVKQDRDAETLRLIREALPEATLYVDGNESFDRQGGMAMLEMCARHRVAWAEEPCHHDDRAARPLVGRGGAVPILGDESCRTPQEVAREIADGAIHMVSIKVARTGFARSRDILGLCRANAIRPMVGSQGDSGLGVVAGGQFCAAFEETRSLPAELSFHLNLADELLVAAPRIAGGRLRLPDGPGLGVEIDRARLARLAVD